MDNTMTSAWRATKRKIQAGTRKIWKWLETSGRVIWFAAKLLLGVFLILGAMAFVGALLWRAKVCVYANQQLDFQDCLRDPGWIQGLWIQALQLFRPTPIDLGTLVTFLGLFLAASALVYQAIQVEQQRVDMLLERIRSLVLDPDTDMDLEDYELFFHRCYAIWQECKQMGEQSVVQAMAEQWQSLWRYTNEFAPFVRVLGRALIEDTGEPTAGLPPDHPAVRALGAFVKLKSFVQEGQTGNIPDRQVKISGTLDEIRNWLCTDPERSTETLQKWMETLDEIYSGDAHEFRVYTSGRVVRIALAKGSSIQDIAKEFFSKDHRALLRHPYLYARMPRKIRKLWSPETSGTPPLTRPRPRPPLTIAEEWLEAWWSSSDGDNLLCLSSDPRQNPHLEKGAWMPPRSLQLTREAEVVRLQFPTYGDGLWYACWRCFGDHQPNASFPALITQEDILAHIWQEDPWQVLRLALVRAWEFRLAKAPNEFMYLTPVEQRRLVYMAMAVYHGDAQHWLDAIDHLRMQQNSKEGADSQDTKSPDTKSPAAKSHQAHWRWLQWRVRQIVRGMTPLADPGRSEAAELGVRPQPFRRTQFLVVLKTWEHIPQITAMYHANRAFFRYRKCDLMCISPQTLMLTRHPGISVPVVETYWEVNELQDRLDDYFRATMGVPAFSSLFDVPPPLSGELEDTIRVMCKKARGSFYRLLVWTEQLIGEHAAQKPDASKIPVDDFIEYVDGLNTWSL